MDNTTRCRVVSRRGFLAAASGGAALGLLGRGSAAWGQGGDWWNVLLRPGAKFPSLADVSSAKAQFERDRSDASFTRWTVALVNYGDLEAARANMRRVVQPREQWGEFRAPLEYCYRWLASREVEARHTVPSRLFNGRKVINIAMPRSGSPTVPKAATEVVGGGGEERKADGLGNEYLEVAPDPDKDLEVVWRVTVVPHNFRLDTMQYRPGELPNDVRPYLGPSHNQDGSICLQPDGPLATQLVADLGLMRLEVPDRLQRIFQHGWDHWHGGPPVPEGQRTSEAFIANEGADCCQTQALARIAVARAAGIPARSAVGMVICTDPILYHLTGEFYINGLGWVIPNWPNWTGLNDWFPWYHCVAVRDEYTLRLDYIASLHPNYHTPASLRVAREWL